MSPARTLTFVAALMVASFAAEAVQGQPRDGSAPGRETARQHVRCLDARAERLLAQAVGRSATVKALVARLDDTDVVIYVTTTAPLDRVVAMPRGTATLVTATAAARYLQVWVDVQRREAERIAVLGHEVQHALEVAADASVRDAQSYSRLFERLGSESGAGAGRAGSRRFETAMAKDIEARVLVEVAQTRR